MQATTISPAALGVMKQVGQYDHVEETWEVLVPVHPIITVPLNGADWFDWSVEIHGLLEGNGLRYSTISFPRDGTAIISGLELAQ
jgi:hypothetical protein